MARKTQDSIEATETPIQPDTGVVAEVLGEEPDEVLPATVNPAAMASVTGITGEINAKDIRFPRLQMAYGVGGLAEKFVPGDLVINGEYLIAHKGEKITVVVLGASLYWKEYLSQEAFKAQMKPRIFMTDREVRAAGGTTEWANGVGPTFSRAGTFRLLIEKPEKLECELFGITLDGKQYAPAEWHLDKGAYASVGPEITSSLAMALKPHGSDDGTRLKYGRWNLYTEIVKKPTTTTPVPRIRLQSTRNTAAFVEALNKELGL